MTTVCCLCIIYIWKCEERNFDYFEYPAFVKKSTIEPTDFDTFQKVY